MNGTIGEIRGFAGNFAPRAWGFCEGQLLSISQNTALFSILGTTYGGDGRTTFALPDLRGRCMVGPGTGPGLSTRKLGQRAGIETTTLNTLTMPNHSHIAQGTISGTATFPAFNDAGTTDEPENNFMATVDGTATKIYHTASDGATLSPGVVQGTASVTLAKTGNGQSYNNMMPFLGIYHVICMQGVFPSRS